MSQWGLERNSWGLTLERVWKVALIVRDNINICDCLSWRLLIPSFSDRVIKRDLQHLCIEFDFLCVLKTRGFSLSLWIKVPISPLLLMWSAGRVTGRVHFSYPLQSISTCRCSSFFPSWTFYVKHFSGRTPICFNFVVVHIGWVVLPLIPQFWRFKTRLIDWEKNIILLLLHPPICLGISTWFKLIIRMEASWILLSILNTSRIWPHMLIIVLAHKFTSSHGLLRPVHSHSVSEKFGSLFALLVLVLSIRASNSSTDWSLNSWLL